MEASVQHDLIRAVIVDDHGIVRQGLRALLTRPGIEVIGEASSGNAAVELARTLHPDVMLLDIRMKDGDGLQALPLIKAVSPGTSVIMLTTYANPGYLARAISSGASGYLLKEANPDQIIRAVIAAVSGEELIDRTLLASALAQAIDASEPTSEPTEMPVEILSDREVEVLRLMVHGLSNQAIAETLHISVPTVKTHVQHILGKLNASDRTQAAVLAIRLHIVD